MATKKIVSDEALISKSIISENNRLLQELLRQIIDSSKKTILLISGNAIEYASPKTITTLGYNLGELKSMPLNEVLIAHQGGDMLGQYLTMSASLKRKEIEIDELKLIARNGHIKKYRPSIKRCFWKGKLATLLLLRDPQEETVSSKFLLDQCLRNSLALKVGNLFVWDYNLTTKKLYVDKKLFIDLGYKPSEDDNSFDEWHQILSMSSKKSFKDILSLLSKTNTLPKKWEYWVMDYNNNPIQVNTLHDVVEQSLDGAPIRIVGLHSLNPSPDSSANKAPQLAKAQETFIHACIDPLVIINQDGVVQEWNPPMEKLTQIKSARVTGKYIWDILHSLGIEQNPAKEFIKGLKDMVDWAGRKGVGAQDTKTLETKLYSPTNEVRIIQNTLSAIKTSSGIHSAITCKDITEVRGTIDRLEKSEERLKIALGASGLGIWDIDFNTNERYFSPMVYAIFGFRPLEVEPTVELLRCIIHPDDFPTVNQKIKSFLASGSIIEVDFRARRKDGTEIWVRSKTRIIKDERNRTIRVTGTLSDITTQKAVENELRQSELELKRNIQQHEVVSEISYLLNTNIPFKEKISQSINLLGQFTSVSRVYIFENTPEGTASNTYEWCNHNISPQKENLQNAPLFTLGSKLLEEQFIMSWRIREELPPDFADLMENQNIKSFLIYRIELNQKLFGFIGFDDCTSKREWTKLEIELLRTVSNLISFSYERELILRHKPKG